MIFQCSVILCDRRYQLTEGGAGVLYVASVSVFLENRGKIGLEGWTEGDSTTVEGGRLVLASAEGFLQGYDVSAN
jgi:hypothetical protein